MSFEISCYYCGNRKILRVGEVVKLACDKCAGSQVILHKTAVFRCALCGEKFKYPSGEKVTAFHNKPQCKGRALILVDYE